MARFEHKKVVVTGGSSGIGRAIVHAFAREGASVLAVARRAERLAEVKEQAPGDRVETAVCDVRDTAQVKEMVRAAIALLGGLDVLVNCAGIAHMEPVLDITEETWDETLATNLTGAFFASQEAARHMVTAGGGAIVNVSSIDAFVAESPATHYCASKAGMVMLTQCMAFELGHLGIRCNAVAPGFTLTPMTADDTAFAELYPAYRRRIPVRRAARPEEQANVVLFLASDEASYVNGETIMVDAGQTKGFWYYPRMEPPVPEQ